MSGITKSKFWHARRRWLLLPVFLIVGAFLYTWFDPRDPSIRAIAPALQCKNDQPLENLQMQFLPADAAVALCDTIDTKIFPNRTAHRKIYDVFMLNDELDMLEIRLNELNDHVDYFVITESTRTFTNRSKPLHLKENFARFAKFYEKIIYHPIFDESGADSHVNNGDDETGSEAWDREDRQKNAMVTQVFPGLLGPQSPNWGDVVLISDLDELPRPATLTLLRNCIFMERTTLLSKFFSTSYRWLLRAENDWPHPHATFYQGENTVAPVSLRNRLYKSQTVMQIPNASRHCSNCFRTVAQTVNKMHSWSHQEFDEPQFTDRAEIVRRVRLGLDLFGRPNMTYERVENLDIPNYVRKNARRFTYLFDRDPPNANFGMSSVPS